MNYVQITSAEKQLFPCAFLLFYDESKDEKMISITKKHSNHKKVHKMANENNKIKLLLLWDIPRKNTDENHAMNADEIRAELEKCGITVIRRVIAHDIATLNEFGYYITDTILFKPSTRANLA